MKCSLYIPVFNQREELQRSLRGLIPEKEGHEVFVVDFGSTDGSQDVAKSFAWVRLIQPKAGRRADALNEAATQGDGELLVFLAPGSLPARGWSAALETHFRKEVDAGHFQCREADSPFPWAGALRDLAWNFGQRMLGGPVGLNGVAVKRICFDNVDGFRPVPDFAWLAFAARLRASGARIQPLKHEILVTPRPGSRHQDAWRELGEDLRAAWKYRKTESFDPARCRRRASVAVLFGFDAFESPSPDGYLAYAREEMQKIMLERLQSFRGVEKCYFIGGKLSTELVGQPSGVEVVGNPRVNTAKRFAELWSRIKADQPEGLLLVRGLAANLTHRRLHELSEGAAETHCMLLPEADSTQWLGLWLEGEPLRLLDQWEVEAGYESLVSRFKPLALRYDRLPPLPTLRTDSDARAMYYQGMLDRLPA